MLRRLFCLLMLPVVFLASTSEAHAVDPGETAWSGQTFRYGEGGGWGQEWMYADCHLVHKWYWTETSTKLTITKSECIGSADLTPGFRQRGEAGGSWAAYVQGPGCGASEGDRIVGLLDDHPRNGTLTVASYIAAQTDRSQVYALDCEPTKLCLSLSNENSGEGSNAAVECRDVAFVPKGGNPDGCQFGTPTGANAYETQYNGMNGHNMHADIWMQDRDPAGHWRMVVAVGPDKGSLDGHTIEGAFSLNNSGTWVSTEHWHIDGGLAGGGWPSDHIIGVHLWRDLTGFADQPPANTLGYTHEDNCQFWFGPTVRPVQEDGSEVPWAGLAADGPTVDTDPKPESPFTEPTDTPTDDLGWLKWIATLLMQVLRAITGLVTAILNMLMDLFIPDPSSWGIDALIDQFEAKPPFSVLGQLGSEASGFQASYGAGDCGTLLNIDVPGMDSDIDCVDVKNAPGMSTLYGLVSVGLVVLTGWGLFKLFSNLFQDGQ